MNNTPPSSSPVKWAVALAIVAAAVIAVGYWYLVVIPRETKDTVVEGAKEVENLGIRIAKRIDSWIHFRPEVKVGTTTVVEVSKNTHFYETVTKDFEHTYDYSNERMLSKKTIKLKARFTASAGFDLQPPFSIQVSDDGKSIHAKLPPARIGKCELQPNTFSIVTENGLWNSVTDADRSSVTNAFIESARKRVDQFTILEDAKKSLMDQLEEAIKKEDPRVTVEMEFPIP